MMLGTVLATVNVELVRAEPSAATRTALRTKPRAREATVPAAITEDARNSEGAEPRTSTGSDGSTGSGAASAVASLPLMPSRLRARRWGRAGPGRRGPRDRDRHRGRRVRPGARSGPAGRPAGLRPRTARRLRRR